MVSKTRVKGLRNQRKAIEYLTNEGWLVSKAEQGGKYNDEKDLFGLYDLVGIRPARACFVQVTTNRPHTHKDYLEFSSKYPHHGIDYIQMVWYDRKGWRIFKYYMGGIMETDLRK